MKFAINLFFCVFVGLNGMAQANQASSPQKSKIASAVSAGEFVFGIPSEITTQQVKESAEYYTLYFTVEHLAKSNQVRITMKENTPKARHIICRFFVSLGVREILIDGTVMSVEEYYQEFLD